MKTDGALAFHTAQLPALAKRCTSQFDAHACITSSNAGGTGLCGINSIDNSQYSGIFQYRFGALHVIFPCRAITDSNRRHTLAAALSSLATAKARRKIEVPEVLFISLLTARK